MRFLFPCCYYYSVYNVQQPTFLHFVTINYTTAIMANFCIVRDELGKPASMFTIDDEVQFCNQFKIVGVGKITSVDQLVIEIYRIALTHGADFGHGPIVVPPSFTTVQELLEWATKQTRTDATFRMFLFEVAKLRTLCYVLIYAFASTPLFRCRAAHFLSYHSAGMYPSKYRAVSAGFVDRIIRKWLPPLWMCNKTRAPGTKLFERLFLHLLSINNWWYGARREFSPHTVQWLGLDGATYSARQVCYAAKQIWAFIQSTLQRHRYHQTMGRTLGERRATRRAKRYPGARLLCNNIAQGTIDTPLEGLFSHDVFHIVAEFVGYNVFA